MSLWNIASTNHDRALFWAEDESNLLILCNPDEYQVPVDTSDKIISLNSSPIENRIKFEWNMWGFSMDSFHFMLERFYCKVTIHVGWGLNENWKAWNIRWFMFLYYNSWQIFSDRFIVLYFESKFLINMHCFKSRLNIFIKYCSNSELNDAITKRK